MDNESQYLTSEKFAELEKELTYLRSERRKEVAEHLEYAKNHFHSPGGITFFIFTAICRKFKLTLAREK